MFFLSASKPCKSLLMSFYLLGETSAVNDFLRVDTLSFFLVGESLGAGSTLT